MRKRQRDVVCVCVCACEKERKRERLTPSNGVEESERGIRVEDVDSDPIVSPTKCYSDSSKKLDHF